MRKPVKAIILAAGKGTRLGSESAGLPKAMRIAAGKTLIFHVLSALDFLLPEDIVIVVGYMADTVKAHCGTGYSYATQAEQRGTGHAAACGMEPLDDFDGNVLVCCCDMPLIRRATYEALITAHEQNENACTFMSGKASRYLPLGRVKRDDNGVFLRIVEEKDASPDEKQITELNAGVYVFDAAALRNALSQLSPNNSQGEYYLTDAPEIIRQNGGRVDVYMSTVVDEVLGVNTVEDLAEVEDKLGSIR